MTTNHNKKTIKLELKMTYGDHAVLQNILRKSLGKQAHLRTMLILDGGGMRGIIGMGACRGLEQMGLTEAFDSVIGVSAGACNGAYLLAQQSCLACSIYTDDLTDKRFINWLRFGKIVDIDYLADYVFRKVKPLDVARIRSAKTDLCVAVTRTLDGKGQLLNVKLYPDIIACLKASMAMPILYNKPVYLGDESYMDGLNSLGVPIRIAVQRLQPTDVLVIMNRPLDYRKHGSSNMLNWLVGHLMLRGFPADYVSTFLRTNSNFNDSIEVQRWSNGKSRMFIMAPTKEVIKRATQNRAALIKAADEATQETVRLFTTAKEEL